LIISLLLSEGKKGGRLETFK